MPSLLVPWMLVALAGSVAGQVDRKKEAGAYGSYVVEAVLDTLKQACIFDDDRLFFRRLAYVETKDGTDPKTYRPGFDGGIWQIDRELFEKTHQEAARLAHYYQAIRSKLGIDWAAVTWSDLRKPLYSGLAAILYLLTFGPPHYMIPPTVEMQGVLWQVYYRKNQTAIKFIQDANSLSDVCRQEEEVEVVFLIPSTSSMTTENYADAKAFVSRMVSGNLTLQGKVRVSMITYSNQPRLDFALGRANQSAIASAQYTGGSRDVGGAIQFAVTNVFNSSRPEAAKVMVLILDGPSNDKVSSITASVAAKTAAGVTIVLVAVGYQVEEEEVTMLASTPPCSHTYRVLSFMELHDLDPSLASVPCKVPLMLQAGEYTYPCGANVLVQVQRAPGGISLEVSLNSGKVDVYGSYDNPLPSVDVHDLYKTVTPGDPAHYFLQEYRSLTVAITSRLHQSPQCTGNFMVKVANAAPKISRCNGAVPDIEMLVDVSRIRSQDDIGNIINFLQQFVSQFEVGTSKTQIGLVTYSDHAQNQFWMNHFTTAHDILDAIEKTMSHQASGGGGSVGSNVAEALQFLEENAFTPFRGMRQNSARTLVLVTEATPSLHQVVEQKAQELHGIGVRIVSVAVGKVDTNLLAILGSGQHHVEQAPTFADLDTVLPRVVKEACGDVYVLCLEGGLQRNCSIEDILRTQLDARIVPDKDPFQNPCNVTSVGVPLLGRIPHPTKQDRFLLCDNKNQVYLVLCPLGEVYSPVYEDCGLYTTTEKPTRPPDLPITNTLPRTTTPLQKPPTTAPPIPGCSNPNNSCSLENMKQGKALFPCDGQPDHYIVCISPDQPIIQQCPRYQLWDNIRVACIYPCVLLDVTLGTVDCSIYNPCLDPTVSGRFPVPSKTTAYIECSGGLGLLHPCRGVQVYKEVLEACDMP